MFSIITIPNYYIFNSKQELQQMLMLARNKLKKFEMNQSSIIETSNQCEDDQSIIMQLNNTIKLMQDPIFKLLKEKKEINDKYQKLVKNIKQIIVEFNAN